MREDHLTPAVGTPRPLLEVTDLVCHFPVRGGLLRRKQKPIQAVDHLSFSVERGEGLGVVGESGCGKSTMANALMRLIRPTSGSFRFDGQEVFALEGAALRHWRREVQLVFQNPYASLDPRMTLRQIVEEPLLVNGLNLRAVERRAQVMSILERVGFDSRHANRYPHQLSGGQRQRVGIARSLVLKPKVLILDEPVSALDVSVQAQVLNLLDSLRRDLGLTFIFIGHDLSVVRHVSERIAVMYLGRIVEIGKRDAVFGRVRHPYTQALLSAVPSPDHTKGSTGKRITLQGDPPSPANPPSGCRFRTRCWKASEICARIDPQLQAHAAPEDHQVACHHPEPL